MNNDAGSGFLFLAIGFLVVIGIFFFCREIVCWYFKINRHIELQEQILEELKLLNKTSAIKGNSNFKV